MKLPLLAIITILGWGIWGFMNKLAVGRIQPYAMVFYTFLFNVVFALPAYYLVKKAHQSLALDRLGLLFLVLAIISAFIASIAFIHLLSKNPASLAIPMTSVYPLLTILLSYLFLGERLAPLQMGGALLVVLGLVLLSH